MIRYRERKCRKSKIKKKRDKGRKETDSHKCTSASVNQSLGNSDNSQS